jgi:hypothetical protein
VIQVYLKILRQADVRVIARIQNPVRSLNFFRTLSRCIHHAVTYKRLIVSHLGHVENPDLVSQMADFLLTYRGTHWSFCTGRYEGKLYVSLRTSHAKADAARILRSVLGRRERAGGHGMIAGGSIEIGEKVTRKQWVNLETALSRRLVERLHLAGQKTFQFVFR